MENLGDIVFNVLMQLQLIFVVLRGADLIAWPWWYVFAPLIIYCGINIILCVIALFIYLEGDE